VPVRVTPRRESNPRPCDLNVVPPAFAVTCSLVCQSRGQEFDETLLWVTTM